MPIIHPMCTQLPLLAAAAAARLTANLSATPPAAPPLFIVTKITPAASTGMDAHCSQAAVVLALGAC